MNKWNEEDIKFIVENEGKMSASQMGKIINKTKSSIIGKLWRLKGNDCQKSKRIGKRQKPKEIEQVKEHVLKNTEKCEETQVIEKATKRINNVVKLAPRSTVRTCQYPFGDNHYTFCGEKIEKGSYCKEHYKLCYRGFNTRKNPDRLSDVPNYKRTNF